MEVLSLSPEQGGVTSDPFCRPRPIQEDGDAYFRFDYWLCPSLVIIGKFVHSNPQVSCSTSATRSILLAGAAEQLEAARALIEVRFADAGAKLMSSLDLVERLIESLDHLGVATDMDSVSQAARNIQAKVGQALTALQIGDITSQRIEHILFGLGEVARSDHGLSRDAQDRLERRLLHLLADQMAETASDFEAEAGKVVQNLAGMAQDGEAAPSGLTGAALAAGTPKLNLREGLGDRLHMAAIVLAEVAGSPVLDVEDLDEVLHPTLATIAARYTMARERAVHAAHAPGGKFTAEAEDTDNGLF
jgi:hypothetical protein